MRIIAHNGAPEWGGAEITLTDLLAGLAGRGHEVTLFANHPVVMERAQAKGIATRQVHLGGDIALHNAVLLSRALRVERPDALLVSTFRKLWLAALGARMAGVPRVVARVGLSTDTPGSAKYRFILKRCVDQVVFVADGMRKSHPPVKKRPPTYTMMGMVSTPLSAHSQRMVTGSMLRKPGMKWAYPMMTTGRPNAAPTQKRRRRLRASCSRSSSRRLSVSSIPSASAEVIPGTLPRAISTWRTQAAQVMQRMATSWVRTGTSYPARTTAQVRAATSMASGSIFNRALPSARLTLASCTPSTAVRARSTEATQPAQWRPSTGSSMTAYPAWRSVDVASSMAS